MLIFCSYVLYYTGNIAFKPQQIEDAEGCKIVKNASIAKVELHVVYCVESFVLLVVCVCTLSMAARILTFSVQQLFIVSCFLARRLDVCNFLQVCELLQIDQRALENVLTFRELQTMAPGTSFLCSVLYMLSTVLRRTLHSLV